MKRSDVKMLGRGVYSISEAAQYTRQHHSTLYSWFKPRSASGRKPVFLSDYPPVGSSYAISFQDLIDVLVAGQLRDCGVSMQSIRKAYASLQVKLDAPHPFCLSGLHTNGKRVLIDVAKEVGDDKLCEALSGQGRFEAVMMPYLKQIDFRGARETAARWHIADGVVIDPAISFGKPVIQGTGTTTYVLANAFAANDRDADVVADFYDLSPSQIRDATAFEDSFRRAA